MTHTHTFLVKKTNNKNNNNNNKLLVFNIEKKDPKMFGFSKVILKRYENNNNKNNSTNIYLYNFFLMYEYVLI